MRGRFPGDCGTSRRHALWSSVYTDRRVNDAGGRRWDGLIMLMKARAWEVLAEMEDSVFIIQALVKPSLIYLNFSGANKANWLFNIRPIKSLTLTARGRHHHSLELLPYVRKHGTQERSLTVYLPLVVGCRTHLDTFVPDRGSVDSNTFNFVLISPSIDARTHNHPMRDQDVWSPAKHRGSPRATVAVPCMSSTQGIGWVPQEFPSFLRAECDVTTEQERALRTNKLESTDSAVKWRLRVVCDPVRKAFIGTLKYYQNRNIRF